MMKDGRKIPRRSPRQVIELTETEGVNVPEEFFKRSRRASIKRRAAAGNPKFTGAFTERRNRLVSGLQGHMPLRILPVGMNID
ncbi:MAG TPA: hypothetical protein VGF01_19805 [Terracidiphilus sp.]